MNLATLRKAFEAAHVEVNSFVFSEHADRYLCTTVGDSSWKRNYEHRFNTKWENWKKAFELGQRHPDQDHQQFQHKDGGVYTYLGLSKGASGRRNELLHVYQGLDGQLYHRTDEDWGKGMSPLVEG